MTIIRMRGIKRYRHPLSGRIYIYHRKSGTRLVAPIGSPAFLVEFAAAEASLAQELPPRPGTLGLLMKAYRVSHYFTGLRPRTRADYDKVMNYLADMDGLPLIGIDKRFVVRLRDKVFSQRGQRFTNYCLAVLSIVMEFGAERGDVPSNVVRGVKRIRRRADAPAMNRPWTNAERETVMAAAPPQLLMPIAIGRWTGLREGDVLAMPRSVYDGQRITLTTSKRQVPVVIPVAPPLKQVIDGALAAWPGDTPQTITLCATSRYKPWTGSGFRSSLFKFLRELEAAGAVGAGLTFHGLRHSVATDMAELGYDDRAIADMLAQESEEMPAHYARKARLEKKLRGVVHKLVRADKQRTKMST